MNPRIFLRHVWLWWPLLVLTGCGDNGPWFVGQPEAPGVPVIEIKTSATGFQLLVDGQPYVIKGAAGAEHLDELKRRGGNTVRTYSLYDIDRILDEAHSLGLMVAVGLDIPSMYHGFNYRDDAAVDSLIEATVADVRRLRDHPAVLMWVAGNEANLFHQRNPWYYWATDKLLQAIKKVDAAHPIMAVFDTQAKSYVLAPLLLDHLDLVGVNVFQDIGPMIDRLETFYTWEGPYLFAEWGSKGYWEAISNDWSVPLEDSDSTKAARYERVYHEFIQDNPRCLGSFVFYWGQKQERTHTWFSLFSEQGEYTPAVDAIQKAWTGSWPANRAPMARRLAVNGEQFHYSGYVQRGDTVLAEVFPLDVDGDSLQISWEFTREGAYQRVTGGTEEVRPARLRVPMVLHGNQVKFAAPAETGPYRLFVYVRDGHGGVGYHNVPLFVVRNDLDLP